MTCIASRSLWLALVTLTELVEQVKDGPAPPTTSVRLALAVCHQHSNGDRAPFVDFWRSMQDACSEQASDTIASYCRTSYLMTQLRGVLRAVGIEPTVAVEMALRDAARKAIAARQAFERTQKNVPLPDFRPRVSCCASPTKSADIAAPRTGRGFARFPMELGTGFNVPGRSSGSARDLLRTRFSAV